MDYTKQMLQAILNGQNALKQELLSNINKLGDRMDGMEGRMDKLDKKIDGVEGRLTERINKIGMQLAYLEDDAPTREEFGNLEKRVKKVEQRSAQAS